MAEVRERDLAWLLADEHRDDLSEAERHTVFIHLGVEDYLPVIVCIVTALARTQCAVPESTLGQLTAWIRCYHQYAYQELVSSLAEPDGTD